MNDTIAAMATPSGEGGISIIRISGSAAFPLLQKHLRPCKGGDELDLPPRTMVLANFLTLQGEVADQVLGVRFPSPKSYTGEDVAEIHAHGGYSAAQVILENLRLSGARMADPGEFTRRAFINGKITLPQAEAILGVITARTPRGMYTASRGVQGETERQLEPLLGELLSFLAEIQVLLDFPEEEYSGETNEKLAERLKKIQHETTRLRERFFSGFLLNQGIHVVLAGKPNVGKSSLFNALLGRDRAIVTPIPGTTRDVVTDAFTHRGITCFLHDVAGLRHTEDFIEKLGIHLAQEKILTCNIILALFDGSESTPEDPYLLELLEPLSDAICIPVISKSDLRASGLEELPEKLRNHPLWSYPPLLVSSLQGDGVAKIKDCIVDAVAQEHLLSRSVYATERQLEEMDLCIEHLEEAAKALQASEELDVVASSLSLALLSLQRILGKEWDDLLLEEIFSKFCVGK
jgi:tRNA modification GTPase